MPPLAGSMQVLRIIAISLRLSVLVELEYRANFFTQILQSILTLLVSLGGLYIVFTHTETLGGWLPAELVALVGIFTLMGGVIRVVIQPGMQQFMEDIRRGTLDFKLTKPADAQLLVSVQRFQIWQGIDIVVGLIILGVAAVQLGGVVGGWQALGFVIALLSGVAIVYSFWMILASISFWAVKVENILVIFQAMYQAGRWPITIYPLWLRSILTFLVPIAFAVTVPAAGFVGRLDGPTLLGAVLLAIFLLLVARLIWLIGIRHYSGASA
jgi:ABC-2 type transport system permease protein